MGLPIQIAFDAHFRRLFKRLVNKHHFVDFTIDRQGFVGGDADDVGDLYDNGFIDTDVDRE